MQLACVSYGETRITGSVDDAWPSILQRYNVRSFRRGFALQCFSFRVGRRRESLGIVATLLYVAMLPVEEGDYTDKAQP